MYMGLVGCNTVLLFRNNILNLFVGLFNICDKILLAVEVLLQWRELSRRGVPITTAIGFVLARYSINNFLVSFYVLVYITKLM